MFPSMHLCDPESRPFLAMGHDDHIYKYGFFSNEHFTLCEFNFARSSKLLEQSEHLYFF